MNYNLQNWLDNEVYPHIFKYADKIFSEHNFIKKGNAWHSNTYINGNPHSRKDKVWISEQAPYCINEQGGESLNFFDYFKKYHFMTNNEVIKFFKEITGNSPDKNYNFSGKSSINISRPKQKYFYNPDNTNIFRFEDYELEERQCILHYEAGVKDYEACNNVLKDNPNAKKIRVFRVAVNRRVVNKNCNPKTFEAYKSYYYLTEFWQNYYLTLCELIEEIKKGHPVIFSHMKQNNDYDYIHRNSENFECSELFALDIDETMCIEDALSKELTEKALFIYTSYNHTSNKHRFRIIFELPFLVTDQKLYSEIVTKFIEEYNSDPATKDACRGFYGNTKAKFYIISNSYYTECA